MKPLAMVLSLVVFVFAAGVAIAQAPSALIAKAEKAFADTKTMKARFTQIVQSKGFGETIRQSGTMALKKPNQMRWEYEEPVGRLMVVDGEKLWYFDPEENIVHFEDLKGVLSPNSPALFLAGEAKLTELFKIDLVKPRNKAKINIISFRLIPKEPQPGVKAMLLSLDGSSFNIVELLMVDHLGNKNRITFDKVDKSAPLEDELFRFKPPAGVPVRTMSKITVK